MANPIQFLHHNLPICISIVSLINIKEGDAIAAVSAVNSSEEETPVQIENQTEN